MITNEEFQSKLAEILQQLQDLEQYPQWNAHCVRTQQAERLAAFKQDLRTSDMNLADALQGVSLAVDRGVPDTLGKSQELLVKAIATEDFSLFTQEVQKFTSSELVKLYRDGVLENDFHYMLWSVCVTWGFQFHWAHLQVMAPEKIESMKQTYPYTDTEIPENFDSSIPLGQVKLWAPQDHMTRVQSA